MRDARLGANLSQRYIGGQVGISHTAISQIERQLDWKLYGLQRHLSTLASLVGLGDEVDEALIASPTLTPDVRITDPALAAEAAGYRQLINGADAILADSAARELLGLKLIHRRMNLGLQPFEAARIGGVRRDTWIAGESGAEVTVSGYQRRARALGLVFTVEFELSDRFRR